MTLADVNTLIENIQANTNMLMQISERLNDIERALQAGEQKSLLRPRRYLTVKQAAEVLQVHTNTIYNLVKSGTIPHKRNGKGGIKIPENFANYFGKNSRGSNL